MSWMLLPPKDGGISMTLTAAFCIDTIFEMVPSVTVWSPPEECGSMTSFQLRYSGTFYRKSIGPQFNVIELKYPPAVAVVEVVPIFL